MELRRRLNSDAAGTILQMAGEGVVQNTILRMLPNDEFALLEPDLEPVVLRRAARLLQREAPFEHAYFVEGGLASLVGATADNRTIDIGVIGREGLVGAAVVLGIDCAPHDCVMTFPGSAYRIAVPALLNALARSPNLRARCLKFNHALMVQSAEMGISHATSSVEARLARCLLMCHDRADSDELQITHSTLARMLSVRRAGVTLALHGLEGERMIRSRRGRIVILDRRKLEEAVRGSYGLAEAEYDRLLGRPGLVGKHNLPDVRRVRSLPGLPA